MIQSGSDFLTADQLATFTRLANILIPAAESMPSASQVDGAIDWLERAISVREDLVPDLKRAMNRASSAESVAAIAAQLQDDQPALRALTLLVAGSYYMNPNVRALIGYPGQEARPKDPPGTPTFLSDGLIERVLERGPIYRPTSR
jgi:hypothetical protein